MHRSQEMERNALFFTQKYFLVEIRLKAVERAQLNFHHRFWSNIVQVGRNLSKLAKFHPNRRRKNQPWVKFQPTWTIFDQNRGGNSTAHVPPFLNEYRPSWPIFFQTGRISPKSAQKKQTMARISANLDDIRPKSWRKFNCARSNVFKRISAKKLLCKWSKTGF
jgi:hypothetical protein